MSGGGIRPPLRRDGGAPDAAEAPALWQALRAPLRRLAWQMRLRNLTQRRKERQEEKKRGKNLRNLRIIFFFAFLASWREPLSPMCEISVICGYHF